MGYKIEVPPGYKIKKIDSTQWELVKLENYLPKTWEEFCEMISAKDSKIVLTCEGKTSISGENEPYNWSPQQFEKINRAMDALYKLIKLRDFYNKEWIPDWRDSREKYVIRASYGEVICKKSWSDNAVLAFKAASVRDQFLENFRDLIEIAKPLL